jgi:hypothetical protein
MRFVDSYSFVLVSTANEIPSFPLAPQGDFIIGGCSGLLYPINGYDSLCDRLIYTDISASGSPDSVIGPCSSDSLLSEFDLLCNDSEGYLLLDELVNTVRASDVDIVAPNLSYMFGSKGGSGDTYTCKLIGSTEDDAETVVIMTHTGYQQWMTHLKFWMKELV